MGKSFLILLFLFLFGCQDSQIHGDMTLGEIKSAYKTVDELNHKLHNGESIDIPNKIVLGTDERNGLKIVQEKSFDCGGCTIYESYFVLYEDFNENDCNGDYQNKLINLCGIAGLPNYLGCAPDTTS